MKSKIQRIQVGRTKVDVLSFEGALEAIFELCEQGRPGFVVTPNADHVVMLEDRPDFLQAYESADLYLCDGMPILWASLFSSSPIKERVTGADLLPALAQKCAENGKSIFLLGAAKGVANQAASRLSQRYPSLQIAGTYCPPFGFENDEALNSHVVSLINESQADFVFVALGAPKQELWIRKNLSSMQKGVFIGVGAAIDFAAGHIKRAPSFFQKTGMEWLYRWATDPKRLTKRYIKDFRFFAIVFRQILAERIQFSKKISG